MSGRRILFIVILIAWLVNGGLLAYVLTSAPPPPPPSKTRLIVRVEKPDQAKGIAKALEALKVETKSQSAVPWKREVVDGFKVYLSNSDADLRKAMLTSLKNNKLPVKMVGEEILLGNSYKTKALAAKAKANADKAGFAFSIDENRVMKTVKVVVLTSQPLDAELLSKAEEALKNFKLKDDQVETQVESETAESATPSASPTP
jgi:hypothetical protein